MKPILYKELTDTIIKIAIEVQKELGLGFFERVYENALIIALQEEGLVVDQQKQFDVYFRGHNVGVYIADLLVEEKIILEIKAVDNISRSHYAQLINYLKASDKEVGYVINFGRIPLQFKRLAKTNQAGEET
ncbi:MAG: GxxExxY protein [Candidatus Marinimicrobia bacterium]|jgi:GxxExxY protein|nr:GxxExxY protein [Candidatus Neomarinimicrobiota bacterium]MBT3577077.1 GxxExxY protein [Candidatus Neomarinimicrobiota bacterium]MBT3679959.1 GxxExxY protein [Candidatus Neomarinimicrobiota bacterium]MBT3949646.1 GxxExxY protein [Candidatus Neomarinimicrobiota bacterium]MBT4253203.1 GxxExxY protein [Candidatus Neomarinimicrobiota bacterium]